MEIRILARIVGGLKALLQQISRFIGSERTEESHEVAKEDRPDQGEVHESSSQLGEPEKVDAFRPIFGGETVQSASDKETSARKTAKKKVAAKKSVGKKKTSVKKKATKKAATKKSVKKKQSTKKKVAKKKTAKKKASEKKTVKKKASKKKSRQ